MILINEVVETIICQFVLDYHFSIEKFGFKINDVFVNWANAQKTHFDDGGTFDLIYK